MSDLKIGQTQAFTVTASDGSAVTGIAVSTNYPNCVELTVTGDASFTARAIEQGSPSIAVSAPGFQPAMPFSINVVPLPTLIVTPGEITG